MATLSAYLRTWRLKLNHGKTAMAAFHLHNREVKHELKVYANGKIFPSSNLPWGKTAQITHVPPPSRDTAQKTSHLRHVSETTFELGMGCWR